MYLKKVTLSQKIKLVILNGSQDNSFKISVLSADDLDLVTMVADQLLTAVYIKDDLVRQE